MVTKWIAWAIVAGFVIIAIPITLTILWTISSAFVSAILLFALIVGIVSLVMMAIDREIQIKRALEELLEQKENDEDESND